jgi:hypothetical protein
MALSVVAPGACNALIAGAISAARCVARSRRARNEEARVFEIFPMRLLVMIVPIFHRCFCYGAFMHLAMVARPQPVAAGIQLQN